MELKDFYYFFKVLYMPRYLSPAKVNLFLRVVGRRPDGFHELSSLFQTINLFDTLDIEFHHDSDLLTVSDTSIPTDGSNLIMKAVALFRQKTHNPSLFRIHLDKKIPMEAGLGGGSSNAATTLWALNEMCGKPATTEQLVAWAAEIGSDVSFFLSQGTALCTGRGEKLAHLKPLTPKRSGWIIKPAFGLSTPLVYKNLDLLSLKQRDPADALQRILAGELCYFNDLEQPAFALSPSMANLKQELLDVGYETVMMTGSGSAILCIGNQPPHQQDNLFMAPISFINRQENSWYC